ncbi:hypothetical protein BCR59_28210 [Klebsiella pneumoniae]|nr:hypothetical protein BCR59_28210 [Klebsiella pneumoniae]
MPAVCLADDQLDLVLLDELTYMVAYDYLMATGFTWNTQDRDSDTAACLAVWEHARRMPR